MYERGVDYYDYKITNSLPPCVHLTFMYNNLMYLQAALLCSVQNILLTAAIVAPLRPQSPCTVVASRDRRARAATLAASTCVNRELVLSGNGGEQTKHSADNTRMFTGTLPLGDGGGNQDIVVTPARFRHNHATHHSSVNGAHGSYCTLGISHRTVDSWTPVPAIGECSADWQLLSGAAPNARTFDGRTPPSAFPRSAPREHADASV